MEDFDCPCCHQPAFPFWRKVLLSPALTATCPKCGCKVTLANSAWGFAAPVLGAYALAKYMLSSDTALTIFILAMPLFVVIYGFAYPIVPRK